MVDSKPCPRIRYLFKIRGGDSFHVVYSPSIFPRAFAALVHPEYFPSDTEIALQINDVIYRRTWRASHSPALAALHFIRMVCLSYEDAKPPSLQ